MKTIALIIALGCLFAAQGHAHADGSLMGRTVSFQIQTNSDAQNPLFVGKVHESRVTDAIEFGLVEEGPQNNLDVIPILVDVSARRIEVSYAIAAPSQMADARFNGYVMTFSATSCTLFVSAKVDAAFTNLAFSDDRVSVNENTLMLNVAGLAIDPHHKLAVDFTIADCGTM